MVSQFGARLRQFRVAAGLTQETLAERSGLSVNAISALERGERRHPYPRTIQALADALGLTDAERAGLAGATVPQPGAGSAEPERLAGFPAITTPTFGRDVDIATAVALLQGPHVRILTLTGPGGVGKTRLAQHVAIEASEGFADGAHFVSLAAITDHQLVEPAIVQALAPHRDGATTLVEVVRGRELLLVLDNFEQVPGAAPVIAHVLHACPTLAVIVTSRRPLHIDGEQEYPVQPLATPAQGVALSLQELETVPAVALFLQRARAVRPDLTLSDANGSEVAALCAQLEGLPLALELAASRAKLLSPRVILANLSSRLSLLTGGGQDRPARLQTMRGAIGWSFDHLQPAEQDVFRRMAVFSGGGTLEAVAAVSSLDGSAAPGSALSPAVLDAITSLIDHSLLIRTEEAGGDVRVGMLEVIREFAREQLVASDEAEAAHDAHATWFLALAHEARLDLEGPGRRAAHDRIQRNLDNLRSALSWLYTTGDAVRTHRLTCELARFWINFGFLDEGWSWLERVLAMPEPEDADVRFDALYWASIVRLLQDQRLEAKRLAQEALALARRSGNELNAAKALLHLGDIEGTSDPEAGRALIEESLVIFRRVHHPFLEGISLRLLGLNAMHRGDYDDAYAQQSASLAIWERIGHRWGVPITLRALAEVAVAQGELATARLRYQESLKHWRELGERLHMSECFSGLARVALASGQVDEAVLLLGAQNRLDAEMGYGHPSGEHGQVLRDARAALPASRFDALWEEGRAMTLDEVLDQVMTASLSRLVQADATGGDASWDDERRHRSA